MAEKIALVTGVTGQDGAYLSRLFAARGGNVSAMAHELGVKSSKLYEWMHEVGLDVRALRRGIKSARDEGGDRDA